MNNYITFACNYSTLCQLLELGNVTTGQGTVSTLGWLMDLAWEFVDGYILIEYLRHVCEDLFTRRYTRYQLCGL